MSEAEIIAWVRQQVGFNMEALSCLNAYKLYQMYREEGQTHQVSKQYAGLL